LAKKPGTLALLPVREVTVMPNLTYLI
jgi:hypothetical protein